MVRTQEKMTVRKREEKREKSEMIFLMVIDEMYKCYYVLPEEK